MNINDENFERLMTRYENFLVEKGRLEMLDALIESCVVTKSTAVSINTLIETRDTHFAHLKGGFKLNGHEQIHDEVGQGR